MDTDNRPAFLRQQLLIDRHVQGTLLQRTALYSVACAVYFIVILVFAETMSNTNATLSDAIVKCMDEAIYWAPGLILLAPLVAYDMLRLTNRFAGPIFRLRREMQRLVDGKSEFPLTFRDGDYWTDFAGVFNKLRDELIELREFKESAIARSQLGSSVSKPGALLSADNEEADEFFSMSSR
ncbi:hypothetical protein [Rubripirellula reticaptiva]|uniref:HAMP domain-containing protein n=1 Tax=Rubripirellula reticaptiva TaxID=2528013 RepID=A0A5C6F7P7_9BACT|nr:hypothetical protein [Rubripirellula reticaptiva]TWU57408.1 hypothetical protein Poly59_03150 [Rubripirellula reticaptiva]